MPDDTTEAEAKLQKLGERMRQAWAKRHPISERSLETVRNAVRDQWEKEQALERPRQQPEPERDKAPEPEPPEPEI